MKAKDFEILIKKAELNGEDVMMLKSVKERNIQKCVDKNEVYRLYEDGVTRDIIAKN